MIPGNFDIDYIIKKCKVDLPRDILEEMLKYRSFHCMEEMSNYYFPIKQVPCNSLVVYEKKNSCKEIGYNNFTIKTFKNRYIQIDFVIKEINYIPFIYSIKTSSKNVMLYTINYEGQQGHIEDKPIFNWKIVLDRLVLDWNVPKFCDLCLVYSRIPEKNAKKKVIIFSKLLSGNHDPFGVRKKWEKYKQSENRRRTPL